MSGDFIRAHVCFEDVTRFHHRIGRPRLILRFLSLLAMTMGLGQVTV